MLAVLLGAFGAHALHGKLTPDLLAIYQTAVQYHFWHALGLLAIGIVAIYLPASDAAQMGGLADVRVDRAVLGQPLPARDHGVRWLGAITPIGGTAFIASWALFAFAIAKAPSS